MCRSCGAQYRPAAVQGPAFAERRAVADLDRYAAATRIQFCPKGVGFVERDWVLGVIMRSEHVHRFTRCEHTTAHVALLTRMVPGSENFFEHLGPVLHWLIVHFYADMFNDRWSDAFVGEGKSNRPIAAIEFQNWPDRSAHLLALHISGVTGNTQSQKPNKRRDDCVVSAGGARLLFLRHGADHIADEVSVNQSPQLSIVLLLFSPVTRH